MRWHDDTRDGILFRFWIRAGSEFPGAAAEAIAHATTPAAYREALTGLARSRGVNLPDPIDADAILRAAGETAAELRKALAEVVSGRPMTRERLTEIRRLAGYRE